jgi:hypothetical protein
VDVPSGSVEAEASKLVGEPAGAGCALNAAVGP